MLFVFSRKTSRIEKHGTLKKPFYPVYKRKKETKRKEILDNATEALLVIVGTQNYCRHFKGNQISFSTSIRVSKIK